MSSIDFYVVVDPKGDRPYVSPVMSPERIEIARREGWVVTLIKGSLRTDGVVEDRFEREILLGPR